MPHVAYLVDVAGRRIAHLGDATADAAVLQDIAPVLNNLDAVFAPPWVAFGSEGARDILRDVIPADALLVGHFTRSFIAAPPSDMPDHLTLLIEPGQTVDL